MKKTEAFWTLTSPKLLDRMEKAKQDKQKHAKKPKTEKKTKQTLKG